MSKKKGDRIIHQLPCGVVIGVYDHGGGIGYWVARRVRSKTGGWLNKDASYHGHIIVALERAIELVANEGDASTLHKYLVRFEAAAKEIREIVERSGDERVS